RKTQQNLYRIYFKPGTKVKVPQRARKKGLDNQIQAVDPCPSRIIRIEGRSNAQGKTTQICQRAAIYPESHRWSGAGVDRRAHIRQLADSGSSPIPATHK